VEALDIEEFRRQRDAVMRLLESQPDSRSAKRMPPSTATMSRLLYNHGYANANFSWSFTPAATERAGMHYTVQEGTQNFLRRSW